MDDTHMPLFDEQIAEADGTAQEPDIDGDYIEE